MRRLRIQCVAAALALVMAGAGVLAGCSSRGTSDEERLKAIVREVADAVERKDVKAALGHFSKDFNDGRGNDYDAVKGILLVQFMRAGNIRVFVRDVVVKVEGERALVDVRAAVVRARGSEKLPDVIPGEAEGLRFSVVCRKEDGRWKALSAEWDEVGAMGLL